MSLVSGLEATLAGLVLLLVPGLLFLALLPREEQARTPPDEALFLLLGVSVALSSWVALGLGELGLFSLRGVAAVLAAAALVLAALARRHLRWGFTLGPHGATGLLPALVILALALGLQARPSEYVVGGRDPGAYVAAMGLIARTGGIEYVDPLVLAVPPEDAEVFFRHPDKPQAFSWGRFMGFDLERPQTGRVYPEFFHLFPAFGACLFAAMGVKGALATPVVFAVLGTLGVFLVVRRLLGPGTALLSGLLLCGCAVHVWFARYPVSETVSLLLYFLALLALARFEASGTAAFAALAGTALGLSLLVRIDAVLVVIPLGLYLGCRLARRDLPWRACLALVLPFALLAAHATFHALFFARKYMLQVLTRRYWNHPPEVWAVAFLATALGLGLLYWQGTRASAFAGRHAKALRFAGVAALLVLSAYAYFLRPRLSAWAGGDGNDEALRWADPSVLVSLGFHRLAAHDAGAFYRMGWFVTPLGLALAVVGLCLLVLRGTRTHLFPGLFLATFAGFYFYKIRIWNDYYFALRRFVPVVLPGLLALAAFALVRLSARNRRSRLLALGLTLGLGLAFARDTARLWRFTDWAGSVAFVRDLSRRFSPHDAVSSSSRGASICCPCPCGRPTGRTPSSWPASIPTPSGCSTCSRPGGDASATSTSSTPRAPTSAASSWNASRPSPSPRRSGNAPTTGPPGVRRSNRSTSPSRGSCLPRT